MKQKLKSGMDMKTCSVSGWLLLLYSGFLLLAFSSAGLCETIVAKGFSQEEVQSAIDAAGDGDTVQVPAGSATWTSSVTASGKSITIEGAGIGQTVITRVIPNDETPALILEFTGANDFITLRGFEFHTIGSAHRGIVTVGAANETAALRVSFRITQCAFYITPSSLTAGYRGIQTYDTYGLIDNCTFVNTGTGGQGVSIDTGGEWQIVTWHTPQAYGDQNSVVIEDCTFPWSHQGDSVIDAYSGAKFVFRHNSVINSQVAWHGADSSVRSARLFEIYQNTFIAEGDEPAVFIRSRGGTGVVWGNTMTSAGDTGFVELSHFRADPNYEDNPDDPGSPQDGGFDQTYPGKGYATGYPLLDQVGRGSFPASNPGRWPTGYPYTEEEYEALEPMYLWNNTYDGNTSPTAGAGSPDQSTSYIVEGRDFYNNTPKPGYTPLAYPHPLTTREPPPPVGVPTISDMPDQSTTLNTPTGAIPFTVGDDSLLGLLSLSASSSNPTLANYILFGGTLANRTVTVTPAAGQTGTATITVTVSYGTLSSSDTFVLTVSEPAPSPTPTPTPSPTPPVVGATWYVDESHPSSSDSPSNGSESKPWKTITFALRTISGGDKVLVKNGTYNEDGLYIDADSSGSLGKETTIAAYPGHSPVFRGLGNTGRIAVDGVSYFTIDGFDISNLNQCIQIRNGSHHITVRNCKVHDCGNELIRVLGNCHDVLFENNIVHDGGSLGGSNGEGFYIGSAGTVDNSYNVTIRGNTIYNTKSEGVELKPGTHDCIVEGNNVSVSNTGDVRASSIEVDYVRNYGSNPNHIVRNNIVHDSGSNSYGIRAGTGCTVYNNVVYNISGYKYAILVDNDSSDSYSRRIYNNTLDVNSTRAIRLRAGAADIRNNIGPSSPGNMVTSNAYYVNAANRDYRLVAGSPPVDAGADLSSVVSVDKDGTARPMGTAFDMGAYESDTTAPAPTAPAPPTNLRIIGPTDGV